MTDTTTPLRFNEKGEGWHLNPRRNTFFKVIGVLGALIFIGPAVAAINDGTILAGVILIPVGLAVGSLPFANSHRPVLPPRIFEGSLLLPTNPMKLGTLLALLLLGPLVLAGGVGVAVDGFRDDRLLGPLIGLVVTVVVGSLMLLGAYAGLKQRRAVDRGILLTPNDVVLRTRAEPVTTPWDDIAEVRDHWTRLVREGLVTPGEVVNNWLSLETRSEREPDVLTMMSGTHGPSVDVESLAVDPHLVLEVLRFYLDHPESRSELASDQALARVQQVACGG